MTEKIITIIKQCISDERHAKQIINLIEPIIVDAIKQSFQEGRRLGRSEYVRANNYNTGMF